MIIFNYSKGVEILDGYTYKVLIVEVPTKNGTRYIYWGGIPLKVVKPGTQPIDDNIETRNFALSLHSDLIQRLQADECEICGSRENCEVNHIRKLSDLKNRWRGRKEKPEWVKRMTAMQRKTLVVCVKCHDMIHNGGICGKVPAKVTRHFPAILNFHSRGTNSVIFLKNDRKSA